MPDQQSRRSIALWALSGCYVILALASLSVVGILEPMSRGLAVTGSQIAYLVTAFALTFAVAAPMMQILFGDLERKLLILLGLGAIGAGVLLTGLAGGYCMVAAGRVLMAVGAAVAGPMASAAGAALVPPEQRGLALAMVFSGMTVATYWACP